MNYSIREMQAGEYHLIKEFLYEAIFIPDGMQPPPKAIVERDELRVYYQHFGVQPHDNCFVAENNGRIVGAVWTRIMNDYGHIDNQTPSLAISLFRDYRNHGIGTDMMRKMIEHLANQGYKQVSLSVDKTNYAAKMYMKLGFEIMNENHEDYIMVLKL